VCKVKQLSTIQLISKNSVKFSELLNTSYSSDILLLPEFAVNWLWDKEILNGRIIINNRIMIVKEVIADDVLFNAHFRQVLDYIINNTPSLLNIKLRLSKTTERMRIKHNVMRLLLVR